MGDQSPQNTMNLDLNLGPVVHPSHDDQPHAMSFEDWLLGSMREVVSNRPMTRPRLRSVWRHMPVSMEARNTTLGLTGNTGGNNNNDDDDDDDDDNEQTPEMIKTNENGDKCLENEAVGNGDFEKNNGNDGSFFDCNICLDLASEPVVTCCGHLFCWPCLYRWLFIHSDSKECPICKGEVTMKTITPIYCRGNRTKVNKESVDNSNVKIPSRPQANRIESWRQSIQRNTLNIPMFEIFRRLDNRFDLTTDNQQEPSNYSLLNRIFTSRGMRRGQDPPPAAAAPDATNPPNRVATLSFAESFVESYLRNHPDERNQDHDHENHEHLPSMEDRHSMSSIAAVMQSESQTGDTAAETDSRVSVSTSSRRRCESSTSRVEDVNSGESRSRRRRLQ